VEDLSGEFDELVARCSWKWKRSEWYDFERYSLFHQLSGSPISIFNVFNEFVSGYREGSWMSGCKFTCSLASSHPCLLAWNPTPIWTLGYDARREAGH
jgi:hypothetical protein